MQKTLDLIDKNFEVGNNKWRNEYDKIAKPKSNDKILQMKDKTDDQGIADEFANFSEILGKPAENEIAPDTNPLEKSQDWITDKEIENALRKLKNGKASPDAMKNELL